MRFCRMSMKFKLIPIVDKIYKEITFVYIVNYELGDFHHKTNVKNQHCVETGEKPCEGANESCLFRKFFFATGKICWYVQIQRRRLFRNTSKNNHWIEKTTWQISANQIFDCTRCSTPKRVTSLRGPSLRHCARATQLLSKKCCSGVEPLATLCPIWPARDLNLWLPAPESNALPLDQLADKSV